MDICVFGSGYVGLVQAAVKELNEADRQIIYLRHTAGLTFSQIAESLEQPLGTVLARGHRALKKLRKMLCVIDEESSDGRGMSETGP